MGTKKKLIRFADNKLFPNVFEPPLLEFFDKEKGEVYKHKLAGKWRSEVFKNDNPIVLELGCGKGEYSVGLGKKFPNVNYIGIDIKGARIWFGAKESLDLDLKNIAFLRTRIDFVNAFFEKEEVDEIWITFPDPQPKDDWEEKRLTSKTFVAKYQKILKKEGVIHLKTDSAFLYENTLEVIKENKFNLLHYNKDIYLDNLEEYDSEMRDILNIKTYYEGVFSKKGHLITYLKFRP
jgi:tRNA (guanine-N7-)-methyltransferase